MNVKLLGLLAIGLIIRIFLAPYFSYYPDLNTYQLWSLDVIRHGFDKFYSVAISDYLPGYIYILWVFGKIYYFINAKLFYVSVELIYKLPSIITDILNSLLIYLIFKKEKFSEQKTLTIVSLYLFNPAFLFDSTFWGQTESIVTFFILSGIYFLQSKKYSLSAVMLTLGQVTKPIVVISLPFILLFMFRQKISKESFLQFFLVCLAVYVFAFIPFSDKASLGFFIYERNFFTSNFWNFTTLNSFNVWSIFSIFKTGGLNQILVSEKILGISFSTWGKVFFLVNYFYLVSNFFKIKLNLFSLLNHIALAYLSMFMFLTHFHERHIYYGLFFLTFNFFYYLRFEKMLLIMFYTIFSVNLLFAYSKADLVYIPLPAWYILILSALNIATYLHFLKKTSKMSYV